MHRFARMRGTCKRDVLVVETKRLDRTRFDQRQRLDRLERGAWIVRRLDVTEGEADCAFHIGDRDRTPMYALDKRAARLLHEDGVGHVNSRWVISSANSEANE